VLTCLKGLEILRAQNFKFHITGGLASSFYGESRFTQDVDIVIRVAGGDSLTQLIQELAHKFTLKYHVLLQHSSCLCQCGLVGHWGRPCWCGGTQY
jgi:hypothetical protein